MCQMSQLVPFPSSAGRMSTKKKVKLSLVPKIWQESYRLDIFLPVVRTHDMFDQVKLKQIRKNSP